MRKRSLRSALAAAFVVPLAFGTAIVAGAGQGNAPTTVHAASAQAGSTAVRGLTPSDFSWGDAPGDFAWGTPADFSWGLVAGPGQNGTGDFAWGTPADFAWRTIGHTGSASPADFAWGTPADFAWGAPVDFSWGSRVMPGSGTSATASV